jgi:hypothetical protein
MANQRHSFRQKRPEGLADQRLCPQCAEPISPAAKLCIHCKSDLTWRRHMQVSHTSLALLIALISVVGSVAPTLVKLLTPQDSLNADVVGSSETGLSLFVVNTGSSLAVLEYVALSMTGPEFTMEEIFVPEKTSEPHIVPGATKTLTVSAAYGGIRALRGFDRGTAWREPLTCRLTLEFAGSGGGLQRSQVPTTCFGPIAKFMDSSWPKMDVRYAN